MTHWRELPARWRLAALVALPAVALAVGLPVGLGIAASQRHHADNHVAGRQARQKPNHVAGRQAHQKPHHVAGRHARQKPPRPAKVGPAGPGAPLVPASGAYMGAYIQPANYTWQAQIAAVGSFEQRIGGALNLVHVYHPWGDPFPSPADRSFVKSGKVLLLTWGGTPDTQKIISGGYDTMIWDRAKVIERLDRPILLEFRHEMDRPNLQWAMHGPRDYIRAWDHIRAIFTRAGAKNVGWVWCPTGYGFQVGRAQAFYPGNAEVDWVCADVYAYSPSQSLQQAAAPFMAWAAHTFKPVIIGEFAVNGAPSAWAGWLAAAGQFGRTHPQIKAMAYFNATGNDSNGVPFNYWLGDHEPTLREFARLVSSKYFRPTIPRGPGGPGVVPREGRTGGRPPGSAEPHSQ